MHESRSRSAARADRAGLLEPAPPGVGLRRRGAAAAHPHSRRNGVRRDDGATASGRAGRRSDDRGSLPHWRGRGPDGCRGARRHRLDPAARTHRQPHASVVGGRKASPGADAGGDPAGLPVCRGDHDPGDGRHGRRDVVRTRARRRHGARTDRLHRGPRAVGTRRPPSTAAASDDAVAGTLVRSPEHPHGRRWRRGARTGRRPHRGVRAALRQDRLRRPPARIAPPVARRAAWRHHGGERPGDAEPSSTPPPPRTP